MSETNDRKRLYENLESLIDVGHKNGVQAHETIGILQLLIHELSQNFFDDDASMRRTD